MFRTTDVVFADNKNAGLVKRRMGSDSVVRRISQIVRTALEVVHSFRPLVAVACLTSLSGGVTAQTTYNFTNTATSAAAPGLWSNGANWTLDDNTHPAAGPNSLTAVARFNLGASAFVTVDSPNDTPYAVSALQFGSNQTGDVTINGSGTNPTIRFNPGSGANGSIAANNGFTTLYVEAGAAATYTLRPSFLFLSGGSAGNPVNHVWEIQGSRTVNIGSPTTGAGGTIQATQNSNNTITKDGTGTLVFNGSNFATSGWTGGLIVNGGTVLANSAGGYSTGTGPVTVNSGATLGGRGEINLAAGATVVAVNGGGTLQAGTLVGTTISPTLSITGGSGLTMFSNSTLAVKLFGTGTTDISLVKVTGAAVINTNKINLDLSTLDATKVSQLRTAVLQEPGRTRSYRVMTASDSLTGIGFNSTGFSVTNLGSFAAGEWSFGTFDRIGDATASGIVTLNFTPVPEPHVILALGGVCAGIGAWRRGRRNKSV